MAKSIVFTLAGTFVMFDWCGNELKWKGQTQQQIDEVNDNKDLTIVDFAKKQLDDRLEGESKEAFLKEAYSCTTAIALVGQLEGFLKEAKKGK